MHVPAWLRRLPVAAGMALLLLPATLAGLNRIALWTKGGPLVVENPLVGVQPPVTAPRLDIASLWSGAYQRSVSRYFGQDLPLFATAVGLKNQVYFSLLGQSGTSSVTVGKHLQLYEPVYSQEYCTRDVGRLMAVAESWADRLAALQRWYEDRGKVFVYVITPSKVATYPNILASFETCPRSALRDTIVSAWDAVLDRHAIRYVDGATLVRKAEPNYPFPLFPRGGTHWNQVAAALTAQALTHAIDAAPTAWKLPEFRFTWQMAPPDPVGRDLTDLLNLPFPRLDYQVPIVSVTSPPVATCRPADIAVVGGSFDYGMMETLEKLSCAPNIDFYNYLFITHTRYPGDVRGEVDWNQREATLFHRANILVLEENESQIIRSNHTTELYGLMMAQPTITRPASDLATTADPGVPGSPFSPHH